MDAVKRIREHLAKLHKAWQDDPNRDGHCKMSEGYVEVVLAYPNWFDAGSYENYLKAEPKMRIGVYSYLFGPSRMHNFDSVEEAEKEVLRWAYTPITNQ